MSQHIRVDGKLDKTAKDAAYMGNCEACKEEDHANSVICKREEADITLKEETTLSIGTP